MAKWEERTMQAFIWAFGFAALIVLILSQGG